MTLRLQRISQAAADELLRLQAIEEAARKFLDVWQSTEGPSAIVSAVEALRGTLNRQVRP